MLTVERRCRTPSRTVVLRGIEITLAGVAAVALPARAAPVRAQEAPARPAQQTQADVPEDWAERAGVCRRTLPDCAGRSTTATRLRPEESLEVDGRLDEAVWRRAAWISDFVQIEPIEGARPSVRTEVSFAYDEETLYVAARNYDPDPRRIRANLSRRDATDGSDRLTVSIDSYRNRRTAYAFTVTAGGGRGDSFTSSDDASDTDDTYDPVWSADADITDEGWFAEMAIPFSQLRFNAAGTLTFGVNVNRYLPSRSEDLFWAPVPRGENGWTSWFGDLAGLDDIETRRPIELVPYLAADAGVTSDELLDAGDPFAERTTSNGRFGADVKVGIGSGLTLDATFNPDFGQVEADPAEVNLSAFPTFFDERRPFFVENADLLEGNELFFSRRIGEPPHGSPPAEFSEIPEATTILGAAKLTGRTAGGLSIGALAALTAEESARFLDETGEFGRARVEPATGWLVLRGLQEFGSANNTFGLALTGVRRDVSSGEPLAMLLNREAYAGEADLILQFEGGLTTLRVTAQGSHIAGTTEAIAGVQQFSSHYFQRPDAGHVNLDPTRTSLTGYRAGLFFDWQDGEHWLLESFAVATSPEFDINDGGMLERADRIEGEIELGYVENRVGMFRTWSADTGLEGTWNYGGDRLATEWETSVELGLRNFWTVGTEIDVRPRSISDTETRGGPLMGTPREFGGIVFVVSDSRNPLIGDGFVYLEDDDLGGWAVEAGLGLQYRPGGAWQLSIASEYAHSVNTRQYVTTLGGGRPETFGNRYVFARLERHTLLAQLRASYAFSPDLSLEGYFEPFAATGRYSDFGELAAPRTTDLRLYGTDGTTIDESPGDAPRTLTVTDGERTFSFDREDFRALSFRSNLVMRWEWLRGSTLFLVWQLDRGGFDLETQPDAAGFGDLLETPGRAGRSFFALKASYWLQI